MLGSTALMTAAEKGHADCVRLLVDVGADKEAKDNVRDMFCPKHRVSMYEGD